MKKKEQANEKPENLDEVTEVKEESVEEADMAANEAAEEQFMPAGEMIELSRYIRLQADFENFKKRSKKDLENMAKYGSEKVVEDLLPILDNFSRALSFETENEELIRYKNGMDMVFKQLSDILSQHGVEKIEAVGKNFDPEYHQAVMQVETDNKDEDNVVLEDFQTGYKLNGKVIRPSMVKVGKHS